MPSFTCPVCGASAVDDPIANYACGKGDHDPCPNAEKLLLAERKKTQAYYEADVAIREALAATAEREGRLSTAVLKAIESARWHEWGERAERIGELLYKALYT